MGDQKKPCPDDCPDCARDKIDDLTAKLAEAERERDSATFDKARMLDERQIFLKGMDERRAEVARLTTAIETGEDFRDVLEAANQILERRLDEEKARLRELREAVEEAREVIFIVRSRDDSVSFDAKEVASRIDDCLQAALAKSHDLDKFEAAEARLRELREWIATAHHLPLCAKWSYALDDQMQIVPALLHDAECTCGRDSALANSGEP